MRKLLLLSYEWFLRFAFGLIILMAGTAILLSLIDYPKVERYLYPLQFLKVKPIKLKDNLWVGAYMSGEELETFLKKNNVEVVVALLDTDFIHERRLLEEERKILKDKGIKLYSVPIKPFIREEDKIRTLKRIIYLNRKRRVYVHSYLGRVRVMYVKEVLGVR